MVDVYGRITVDYNLILINYENNNRVIFHSFNFYRNFLKLAFKMNPKSYLYAYNTYAYLVSIAKQVRTHERY